MTERHALRAICELGCEPEIAFKHPVHQETQPHTATKNRMSGPELFVQFLRSPPAEEPPDGCICLRPDAFREEPQLLL